MGTEEQQYRGDRGIARCELGLEGVSNPATWRYWIKRKWVNANARRPPYTSSSNVELQKGIEGLSPVELAQLNQLLDWKLDRYLSAKAEATKGTKMQDQITIELRVDFADKDMIPELVKIACSMARTLVANVQLLGPTCQPECVVFTDNFMSPPEKVDLYADLIGKGREELTAAATAAVTGEDQVSGELLDAMKGS